MRLKPKLKAPAQGKTLSGHHFTLWKRLLNQGSNRSSKRLSNKQWCLEGFELLRDFGYYNTKSKGRPAKCAKDAPAGRRILVRPSFQSPCLPLSLCLSHSLILCGNSRHKLSTSYFWLMLCASCFKRVPYSSRVSSHGRAGSDGAKRCRNHAPARQTLKGGWPKRWSGAFENQEVSNKERAKP